MQLSRTLARWFPVPQLLVPNASGVDITDASVKWLTLSHGRRARSIANYGSEPLAEGIVHMGAVKNTDALAAALKDLKRKTKIGSAHAALPEEAAYVFSMHVHPGSTHEQIINVIEFELEGRVPIPPKQAVYDFDFVGAHSDEGEEIAVTVFPRELAEGYIEAFSKADIELLSLEIEARSIARAVSAPKGDPVTLLVDCGMSRTGVAILKNGIPTFTSTVDIGGAHLTRAVVEALGVSEEDAQKFKNEHGLVANDPATQKAYEAVNKVAAGLAEEIARHYRFWDTRRSEQMSGVERVLLVGGSVNLKGLPEYIAGKVHAFTERPNVWRNVCSFDDYIPPIPYRTSFQYATAIGLALRSTSL